MMYVDGYPHFEVLSTKLFWGEVILRLLFLNDSAGSVQCCRNYQLPLFEKIEFYSLEEAVNSWSYNKM